MMKVVGHLELYYIDYLDYTLNHSKSPYSDEAIVLGPHQRLKYDLLTFCNDEQLCLSVPACIKLESTAMLLMELEQFWNDGRIVMVLDENHKLDPNSYFSSRKRKLESTFREDQLASHFEYQAYMSKMTTSFFNTFMNECLSVKPETLYIPKKEDTDSCFRKGTYDTIEKHGSGLSALVPNKERVHFNRMLYDIEELSNNQKTLFQRTQVLNTLDRNLRLNDLERRIASSILDKNFAVANAVSANALPVSYIPFRLTGENLAILVKKNSAELFENISRLNFLETHLLTQQISWRCFIDELNYVLSYVLSTKSDLMMVPAIKKVAKTSSKIDSIKTMFDWAKDQAVDYVTRAIPGFDPSHTSTVITTSVDFLVQKLALKYGRNSQYEAMKIIEGLDERFAILLRMTKDILGKNGRLSVLPKRYDLIDIVGSDIKSNRRQKVKRSHHKLH